MEKQENIAKYQIKVKSSIHPDIHHSIEIDLHCYERLPKKKKKENCVEKENKQKSSIGSNKKKSI